MHISYITCSFKIAVTETFPILSNLSSPGLGRYVKLSQFCFERDINRSMQHGLELEGSCGFCL